MTERRQNENAQMEFLAGRHMRTPIISQVKAFNSAPFKVGRPACGEGL